MLSRTIVCSLLGLGMAVLSPLASGYDRTPLIAERPELGPSPAELNEWILDLSSKNFGTRMEAQRKLTQAGLPAVKALTRAAETDNLELATRCISILEQWATSDESDKAIQTAAEEALKTLSKSEQPAVAARAEAALEKPEDLLTQNGPFQVQIVGRGNIRLARPMIRRQLEREVDVEEQGKKIHIEEVVGQKITVKVTETEDGEEKTSNYEASNAAELKKKHPEIYELYVKHIKRAKVKANAQPALVPAQAVPIQIQMQIQGQVLPAQGVQIQMRNINGNREINVKDGGKQIDITDENQKNIKMKVTETVEGKEKTSEYKAKDLEELKKNHPEAAKLYEKYAGQQQGIVFGGGIGGFLPGNAPPLPALPQARPVPVPQPAVPPQRNPEAEKRVEDSREELTRATQDLHDYIQQGNPQAEVIQDLFKNIQDAQKGLQEATRELHAPPTQK